MSGVDAARRAGVSQASVSRWESGKYVPTLGDVRALARVYQASRSDRLRMERLVSDLREAPNPPARLTMRRAGAMQQRIGRIEDGSALIRSFHPLLISGLLQTEDYARAVFRSGGDLEHDQVEDGVSARRRRAGFLEAQGRTFSTVLTEGALRWPLGSFAVMAAQIDHIIRISHRPNVHIGVISGARPVDVAVTHGFDVFDERAALVGIETATGFLTDPRDVAAYLKVFGDLSELAVFGDDARVELERAAELYR